jgi:hypothetical protein
MQLIKIYNFYWKHYEYLTKLKGNILSLGNVCNMIRSIHVRNLKGEVFVNNFPSFLLLKTTVSYSNSS